MSVTVSSQAYKAVNDTEHALEKHLLEIRFLGADFDPIDPTLDHRTGGRGSGCNSRLLTAVYTHEANIAQVKALCLVPSVERVRGNLGSGCL
jgi:hypothetical protein